MDKIREARRSTTMAASNGVSKRRQRISDTGRVEMNQEVVTVRDRPEKKERDRESTNRCKRRRSERFTPRNERDVEDDSSDESLVGDDDVPASQNSSFQHNYLRKSFPSARISRHAMGMGRSLKVADEMIGVPVPRKARSACIKRSHDCRTSSGSGGVGFGDDRRRTPTSPASYSCEAISPSCSTVSVRQKMNVNGSKSRIPKPPKTSGTIEDDLEIEIAEVLSGLKKHPQSSKREDDSENSLKSSEVKAGKKLITEGDDSSAARIEPRHSANFDKSEENPVKSMGLHPETYRTNKTEISEVAPVVYDIRKERELKQETPSLLDGLEENQRLESKGVSEGPQSKNSIGVSNSSSKLEIDLMVPPTMPSSPLIDSVLPLVSDSNPIVTKDYNKMDSPVKSKEEINVKKEMAPDVVTKNKFGKREWLNLDLERPSHETFKDSSPRSQNLDWNPHQQAKAAHQSSVLPLPTAVGANFSGLPPHGYVPLIQTGNSINRGNGPSTPGQPRPKRCATHFFIARNIQLHQHFVKTTQSSQPKKGSVHLKGGGLRLDNLDVIPSSAGNSLQGSFPILTLNSQSQHNKIPANIPAQKDKASENGKFAETTRKKPQPPLASGSIVPAPAFMFPQNHHLQPVIAAVNHFSVPSKSPRPANNPCPAAGSTSVNFSYPSSSANEASPYFTVLPSNAYSFQMSTSPATRSGTPSQALPFFNGSYYSPQMFQPPQLLLKQSQSQKDTKASSCSSSSHKQPHPKVGANSFSTSATVQKQRLQSTAHQSQKSENKTAGDNSSVFSDSRGTHTQKGSYGQNMTAPAQPPNFSMSFASFAGGAAPASLNFSSNGGYHIVSAPPIVQQKNHQASESKTVGGSCSINAEDPKKTVTGKPPPMSGQTLVFDNPTRTLNFVSGTWPLRAAIEATSNGDPSVYTQQFTQPQQQQLGRSKTMNSNNSPATSLSAKFPNGSVSGYQQTHSQAESVPALPSQWKNPATSSLTSCSSLNLKQFQSQQQQQQIRTQGQTQISFATSSKPNSVQPSQGQQGRPGSSHPQSHTSSVTDSGQHGKTPNSNKTLSLSPGPSSTNEQMESSASGSNQKSSPVCGRNVAPIISSCPGHLSELKY